MSTILPLAARIIFFVLVQYCLTFDLFFIISYFLRLVLYFIATAWCNSQDLDLKLYNIICFKTVCRINNFIVYIYMTRMLSAENWKENEEKIGISNDHLRKFLVFICGQAEEKTKILTRRGFRYAVGYCVNI